MVKTSECWWVKFRTRDWEEYWDCCTFESEQEAEAYALREIFASETLLSFFLSNIRPR